MRRLRRARQRAGGRTDLDERLVEAIGLGRCPVCRTIKQAEERYWDFFLYETFQGPGAKLEVRGSIGYCPRHLRQLEAHNDLLPSANMAHESVLGALERLRKPRRGWFWRRSRIPTAGWRCPVCRQLEPGELYALQALGNLLESDRELAAVYQRSEGLCFEHAARFLESRIPGAAIIRARILQTLEQHLEETGRLVRSFDYQKESAGRELAGAWRRAFLALRDDPGRIRVE